MSGERHIVMLVVVVLVALETAPARAQSDLSEDEKIEIAKQYMEVGQALYTAGKFDEAAENFLKAYEAQNFAAFLFNAGVAFEKGKLYEKAVHYFKRYLEEETGAPDTSAIEARIAQLEPLIVGSPGDQPPVIVVEKTCGGEGQPECEAPDPPEPPPVAVAPTDAPSMKSIVKIRTSPEGAKVIILDKHGNELHTAISPVHQTLEPGSYDLRVEHPEYKAAETPIIVSEGRVYVVVVELSQGTFLGYLKVKSSVPGAKVFIDDRDAGSVGVTPWAAPIPTGEHHLWIEQPGYEPFEKDLSLGVGDTVEIDVQMARVEYGELHVIANVDFAQLAVDDELKEGSLGEGLILQLPQGVHEVFIQAKGLKTWISPVDISKGMRTKVLVRMNPKPSRKPAWVSFGLATAFLACAIGFAVKSEQVYDDFMGDKRAGFLDNNDPRFHETLGWVIGADFSFLMATIMTIVGIVYMVRDPLADSEGMIKDPVEFAELPEYE